MTGKAIQTTAKKLTPAQQKKLADQAFKLEQVIKAGFKRVGEAWWELSEALYEFHEGGYWKWVGYDTLDEFLAQPDLGISRSQFFAMTKLWKDLVITRQIPPKTLAQIEPSKAREVAPAIMRGDVKIEDALDDARGLGYRDVVEKYRPDRRAQHKQKPDDSTPLAAEDEIVRVQCELCGSWYVAPDEEGDGTA